MISDMEDRFQLTISDAQIGDIMTTEEEIPCTTNAIEQFPHLQGIELHELEDTTVGLLISSNYAKFIFGKDVKVGEDDEPIAVKTGFGWTVIGPKPEIAPEINEIYIDAVGCNENITIENMLRYIYRHDFIGRPEEDFPPEVRHNSQYDN